MIFSFCVSVSLLLTRHAAPWFNRLSAVHALLVDPLVAVFGAGLCAAGRPTWDPKLGGPKRLAPSAAVLCADGTIKGNVWPIKGNTLLMLPSACGSVVGLVSGGNGYEAAGGGKFQDTSPENRSVSMRWSIAGGCVCLSIAEAPADKGCRAERVRLHQI